MIAPILVAVVSAALAQQPTVSGTVIDSATHAPIARVIVLDVASRRQTLSDSGGHFSIATRVPATLRFAHVGYASREVSVSTGDVSVSLAPSPRTLEEMTVTAFRAGSDESAPVSQHTLTHEAIDRRSFGQEVPLLLQSTPSMTSYAE